MRLNSRFTGSVSKLQLHLKQQRLLLFVAALSLLLSLFNFKDWKIFSPVPFSPGQYHTGVTTAKTEQKTITPKKYSCFFKPMCRSPLSLLQQLQESSYSVTSLLCCSSRWRSLLLVHDHRDPAVPGKFQSKWLHWVYLYATTIATIHYLHSLNPATV